MATTKNGSKTSPKKDAGNKKPAVKGTVSKKLEKVTKPYTKGELLSTISEHVDLSRKQVAAVFDKFADLIEAHLTKGAPGVFVLPGLIKFQLVRKPATKARKGINPFTKEEVTFQAKPARNMIKVKALKKLKDLIQD